MELTQFDLGLIVEALELMKQRERDARTREIIQSTKKAVTDIMHEYHNDIVFEVTPAKF